MTRKEIAAVHEKSVSIATNVQILEARRIVLLGIIDRNKLYLHFGSVNIYD